MNASFRLAILVIMSALTLAAPRASAQNPDTLTLSLQPVATGLTSPLFVTHAPVDSQRIFILQRNGFIRIVRNDSLLPRPFLNIQSRVVAGGEQGLLGLAFHPQYPDSPYFYVDYTASALGGDTRISRFTVSPDPDSTDPATEEVLLTVEQFQANHNGGMLAFGPDGYLYIALGDGGGSGDPRETGQAVDSLLGKILRIDVNGTPYAIPPDNPLVGQAGRDEIWAIGLRNPWRFSFDRLTGDLWIADVGQNAYEEVDFEPASSGGGVNYGWSIMEGNHCYGATSCDQTGLTLPLLEYAHTAGRCSISGGYVYRGCAIPDLAGWYFYGDYCTGEIWRVKRTGPGTYDGPVPLFDLSDFQFVSMGEDYYGELYVCELNTGTVKKLVHDGAVEDYCAGGTCCMGTVGNVNDDQPEEVDISDLTALVNHLFVTFTPLACPEEGNINGDVQGDIDISDLTRLVNFLFVTFEPLPSCP